MIGIFGGSGFYNLLENAREVEVDTPYGKPSDKLRTGKYAGREVVFLPRHGARHHLPPHKIPYRANLWAMKEAGVSKIIGPCAAGSLQAYVKPGDFVICDSYIDRTKDREDTFYDGPEVRHISSVDPYCENLRQTALNCCRKLNIAVHDQGTVVVIQGPRFSTKSESLWFSNQGFEVINMTGYPEVALANELGICYVNISLITDYDAGLEGKEGIKASSAQEILETFQKNNERVKKLVFRMIEKMDLGECGRCKEKVEQSKFN